MSIDSATPFHRIWLYVVLEHLELILADYLSFGSITDELEGTLNFKA
jgi:hypothetical protein